VRSPTRSIAETRRYASDLCIALNSGPVLPGMVWTAYRGNSAGDLERVFAEETVSVCPTCKRKMPSPKLTEDKRLVEDRLKAKRSLAVLESCLGDAWYFDLADAIRDEQERLIRALSDSRLLWSIYRRADKGKLPPYYEREESIAA
jgi:hypothetical protein